MYAHYNEILTSNILSQQTTFLRLLSHNNLVDANIWSRNLDNECYKNEKGNSFVF